ncbi:MAG: iron-containing alcohol dehydrogenase [Phycisphaerales bacterium]|nr:iron-containing alcohol dehydrogenase [Phycisphaerales bacterium]
MQSPPSEIEQLPDLLCGRAAILITGGQSFKASGASGRLQAVLDLEGTAMFQRAGGKPSPEDARAIASLVRAHPDAVLVAVGGGAVMDLAKAGAAIAATGLSDAELIERGLPDELKVAPIIAVPTTFGSGSEATQFSVLYTASANRVLAHASLVPEACILDASLGASAPHMACASACFDALAQAIEAHWSTKSTDQSLAWSSAAMQELVDVIEPAVIELDPAAMQAQAHGAWLAGRAINEAFTTAGHALSYGFTIQHDVPHGAAVALVLPGVADHLTQLSVASATDARGADWTFARLDEIGDALKLGRVEEIGPWLRDLRKRLGLPSKVAGADPKRLATTVDPQRLATTPRAMTAGDASRIQAEVCG